MDDLAYARARAAELGPRFCLTFVKGADERTALARMGAYPDTVAERTGAELDGAAAAIGLGRWSVVIEPGGAQGADHVLLEAVSRGTEALSVLRDDAASPRFTYAVAGTTSVAFDPAYPSPELTWGADPELLRHLMRAIGLREPAGEDEETWRDAEARAMVLAQRLTGARIPEDPLGVSRLSARIEPWFVGPARPGDLLRPGRRFAEVFAAVDAAGEERRWEVAVAQVRRLAGALGVADAPGLSEALEQAARGAGRPVTMDSALGREVRRWLEGPPTELRTLAVALRGVLGRDAVVALRAALRPLLAGPGAEEIQAGTVAALRAP
ncbi:DUF6461 domain-containing protein [Couchioplanes caeruleus]|uniref:Uncharacterized protein n=2 Tax=Couchioplanes caeruleus TaxID=56438 RepID=A0A1K0F9R6_9ACTN|nr:DUF6461 domain-containing protein [Couchioplanes caeruleus]OJF09591.1 hypothetical protein BG844_36730 [Couchioplanes caeruleus subsp. caeruleus]ROP27418.1 hypothetical protein EDD30_0087 [Couchioplanes caeruleus]